MDVDLCSYNVIRLVYVQLCFVTRLLSAQEQMKSESQISFSSLEVSQSFAVGVDYV
jgi:hypothetical protein